MEKLKEGGRQIAAGGAAGFVEVCLMHPLDVVKTRLQLGPTHFSSLSDVFKKTYKREGIGGFYKGIFPPILAETPKRATKFFTFEQYKLLFASPSIPMSVTLSFAGLMSGCTEAIVICPFEVVKVRLQSEHSVQLKEQKSTWAVAREIIRNQGLGTNGIYRGLTSTLGRHGVWNMFYFGLYHNLKPLIPTTNQSSDVAYRLLLGFTAGTIASVANIPFDVVKSRIQGPQPASGRKYVGCWQSIKLVKHEEGVLALYRGLVPKVMRLGPGGAIMLIIYETVYDFLKKGF